VLLIEDNRLMREELATLLNGQYGIQVVATADGAGGIAVAAQRKPQVVLVNAGLGFAGSHACLSSTRTAAPLARIVVMDLLPMQGDVVAYIKAGAIGFIVKDATIEDVVATIQAVAMGEHVMPPVLAGALFSHIADQVVVRPSPGGAGSALAPSVNVMTRREREVTALVAEGLSNKEIATRLNLATHTIKTHMHSVLTKLALRSRLQLAAYAHHANRAAALTPGMESLPVS
jgi:DNA-binding NarL/FixJ family response regulator